MGVGHFYAHGSLTGNGGDDADAQCAETQCDVVLKVAYFRDAHSLGGCYLIERDRGADGCLDAADGYAEAGEHLDDAVLVLALLFHVDGVAVYGIALEQVEGGVAVVLKVELGVVGLQGSGLVELGFGFGLAQCEFLALQHVGFLNHLVAHANLHVQLRNLHGRRVVLALVELDGGGGVDVDKLSGGFCGGGRFCLLCIFFVSFLLVSLCLGERHRLLATGSGGGGMAQDANGFSTHIKDIKSAQDQQQDTCSSHSNVGLQILQHLNAVHASGEEEGVAHLKLLNERAHHAYPHHQEGAVDEPFPNAHVPEMEDACHQGEQEDGHHQTAKSEGVGVEMGDHPLSQGSEHVLAITAGAVEHERCVADQHDEGSDGEHHDGNAEGEDAHFANGDLLFLDFVCRPPALGLGAGFALRGSFFILVFSVGCHVFLYI